MRNRLIGVEDFVKGLVGLEKGLITLDHVAEYVSEHRVRESSLTPYVRYREERYTRNLIHRDPLFEVMIICWKPGQKTPVHSHNGQLGWMLVERGGVTVTNYRYESCNAPQNQNVVGLDCLAGATSIKLSNLGHQEVGVEDPACTVDKIQTIHHIECPEDCADSAISLHIYSVPFESCVAYDLERGRCMRRDLFWDSEYGRPLDSAAAAD